MRQTHTVALLELSEAAYQEIRGKLEAAGYQHAFGETDGIPFVDMSGIGVTASKDPAPPSFAMMGTAEAKLLGAPFFDEADWRLLSQRAVCEHCSGDHQGAYCPITYPQEQCSYRDPDGRRCVLTKLHRGDHALPPGGHLIDRLGL